MSSAKEEITKYPNFEFMFMSEKGISKTLPESWSGFEIYANTYWHTSRKGKAHKYLCVGVIVYKCECLKKMQKYM